MSKNWWERSQIVKLCSTLICILIRCWSLPLSTAMHLKILSPKPNLLSFVSYWNKTVKFSSMGSLSSQKNIWRWKTKERPWPRRAAQGLSWANLQASLILIHSKPAYFHTKAGKPWPLLLTLALRSKSNHFFLYSDIGYETSNREALASRLQISNEVIIDNMMLGHGLMVSILDLF